MNWLNAIYDATVGLHYSSSATNQEVLVIQYHNARTRFLEPLQNRSGPDSSSGALNAPATLF